MSILGQGTVNIVFEYMKSWNELKNFVQNNKSLPRIPINFDVKTKQVEDLLKNIKLTAKDEKAVIQYTNLLKSLLKQYQEIAKANKSIADMTSKNNTELNRSKNILGEILRLETSRKNMNKDIRTEMNNIDKTQTSIEGKEKRALEYTRERLAYLRRERDLESQNSNPRNQRDDSILRSSDLYQLSYVASQISMVSSLANSLSKSSLSVQREIERSLVITNSVAKGNAESLRQLYDMTTQLGRVAPVALEEIANSMYELASAGLSTNEIMQAMPQATKLAIGVGENLDTVLNTLISTVNGFDKNFSDSNRILDIFAKAVANSQATIEKLNVSFSRVAPFAQEAGVSIEETTTMLSLLYDRGMSASRAGTVMTNVMQYLSKFSDKATEALLRNGLSTTDVDLKYVSFKDSIIALANANLDASASYDIFGQRGKLIVSIFEQMRSKAEEIKKQQKGQISDIEALGLAYDSLNDQILGAGSVNDFFNATIQTTDYTLNQASNSWKELKLNIAETTKLAFVPFVELLTSVMNHINDAIKSNNLWRGSFAGLVTILSSLGILGALTSFAMKIQATIGLMRLAGVEAGVLGLNFKRLGATMGVVTVALGVLVGVMVSHKQKAQDQAEIIKEVNVEITKQIDGLNELVNAQKLSNDTSLKSLNLTTQQKTAVEMLEKRYGTHITTLGQLREAQNKYNDSKAKGIEIDSIITEADLNKQAQKIADAKAMVQQDKTTLAYNKALVAKVASSYGYKTDKASLQNLEKVLEGKWKEYIEAGKKNTQGDWQTGYNVQRPAEFSTVGSDLAIVYQYLRQKDPAILEAKIAGTETVIKTMQQNYEDMLSTAKGKPAGIYKTVNMEDYMSQEGKSYSGGEYKDFSIGTLKTLIGDRVGGEKFKLQEQWNELGEEGRKKYSGDFSKYQAVMLGDMKDELKNWIKDYAYNVADFDPKVVKEVFGQADLDKIIESAIFGATPKKWQDGGKTKTPKVETEYTSQILTKDSEDLKKYDEEMAQVGKEGLELYKLQLSQAEARREELKDSGEKLKKAQEEYDKVLKTGTITGKEISFGLGDTGKAKEKIYEEKKDNLELALKANEELKKTELDILKIKESINKEQKSYTASVYEEKNDLADALMQRELLNMSLIEQLEFQKAILEINKEDEKVASEQYALAYQAFQLAKSKATGVNEKGELIFSTKEDVDNYNKASKNLTTASDKFKTAISDSIKLRDSKKDIDKYNQDLKSTRKALEDLNKSDWSLSQDRIKYLDSELEIENKKEESKRDQLKIAEMELEKGEIRKTQLEKQASILATLTSSMLTGSGFKVTGEQLISKGYEMAGKGKGAGSGVLALGVIQQLSDNIMSEKMSSLEFEKQALVIRKQTAKTEEEKKAIAEEELSLAKKEIDLKYKYSTNFAGITGTAGGILSGATSGAMAGSSFGGHGAVIGAGLGGIAGLLGVNSAKDQAEREKYMLEYQARMTEYLERVALNTEGSNTYLETLVNQSTSVGMARARQNALDTFLTSATTNIGGSATASWNDRIWHGGLSGKMSGDWEDRWIQATSNFTAESFGYTKDQLNNMTNLQALLKDVQAKQATLAWTNNGYNVTEGSQAQARADYLALQNMANQLQTIIEGYKKMAPAIYKSYFGATLTAVKDTLGNITSYTADWSEQISNILNEAWTETINGFSRTANLSTKTIFEGIMKSTTQNSSALNANIDKIILLQEKISEALLYQQQGIYIDSDSTASMESYFKELIALVNEQDSIQESLNAKAKEYIKLYLDNGGKIEDIMSYMSDASEDIYNSVLSALNNTDVGALFDSLYSEFSKNYLQPYYKDMLDSSKVLKELMINAMSGTIDTSKLSDMSVLIETASMSSKELSANADTISKILGLSAEAMAQFINLKKAQESLEAISEAYELYDNTKATLESAIESGFLEGINNSGEYSREALENSFGKTLKDIIFQNIIDGVLTQTALQAKINYLSKNMMALSATQIEALMNSILSDADKIFEGLEPFIDSMNDIFDKYTGVNDEPIVFFDETNLKLAQTTADTVNSSLNDIITNAGGTAISTIDELLNKTSSITSSLNDLLKNSTVNTVNTTSTKTVVLKIEANSNVSEIQTAIATALKDKVDTIEILY